MQATSLHYHKNSENQGKSSQTISTQGLIECGLLKAERAQARYSYSQ